jgi:hypothetical protein
MKERSRRRIGRPRVRIYGVTQSARTRNRIHSPTNDRFEGLARGPSRDWGVNASLGFHQKLKYSCGCIARCAVWVERNAITSAVRTGACDSRHFAVPFTGIASAGNSLSSVAWNRRGMRTCGGPTGKVTSNAVGMTGSTRLLATVKEPSPMPKSKSRKKKSPKRVLGLPDLEQSKTAVLNSLTSAAGLGHTPCQRRATSGRPAWELADAGTGTEVARTLDASNSARPARSCDGGHFDRMWIAAS